jgi:hypothetical protein
MKQHQPISYPPQTPELVPRASNLFVIAASNADL